MCGIFGVVDLRGKLDADKLGVPNETDELKHRGPDDYGHYLGSQVYLGHRRLSIIDLSSGKQPIFNEDGTVCVVFNGEIYNFQELRTELARRGHRFKTNSDTETIIHAYEEWGGSCVEKFRGMFSFAIWDARKKRLFAARDRLGIKPFFYAALNGKMYFASEMKSILKYDNFPRSIDHDAVAAYFTLSYIPAPLTIFRHIRKLPPGFTMEVSNGNIKLRQYWDFHFQPDRSKPEKYFIDRFMGLLDEAVKLRMISDVPIGAFLSGGVDSGTVVALMSKHSADPVNTCCIGFGGEVGGYLDERVFAKQVANKYFTNHQEYVVSPNINDIIADIVKSFDEPFADHSTVPTYYLCKVTRERVTVALSGLGGDELFGGYERYLGFKLSTYYNLLPKVFREDMIRPLIEKIPERADGHYTVNHLKRFVRSASLRQDERYYGFLSMFQDRGKQSIFAEPKKYEPGMDRCRELILGYFNSANAGEPLDRVFYCDIKTYLSEDILACTDRMSMRHSLEVRVPFLDHKLMEFCATIPHEMKIRLGEKKHILRKAVSGLLPESVMNHRKQGFVGPLSRWLQTDLKESVGRVLSKRNLNRHNILSSDSVTKVLNEHYGRVQLHDKLIWSFIVFQTWYEMYIEGDSEIQ